MKRKEKKDVRVSFTVYVRLYGLLPNLCCPLSFMCLRWAFFHCLNTQSRVSLVTRRCTAGLCTIKLDALGRSVVPGGPVAASGERNTTKICGLIYTVFKGPAVFFRKDAYHMRTRRL